MDITTQVRDPLRAPTTMTHSTRTQQYFRAALLTDASRQLVAAVLHTVGIWTAAAFDFGTPLAAHTPGGYGSAHSPYSSGEAVGFVQVA